MKQLLISYCLLVLVSVFVFPEPLNAQRTVVKRSKVVVRKRAHVRPVRARRVAHYRYRALPRWGRTVRTVGAGAIGIRFGGIGYRFHKGIWYRPKGKRFIVARAPFGARVGMLPVGHLKLAVGPNTYFYYYGTYYSPTIDSKEYQVVEAPIGAEVDALPEGYTIVKINDKAYYKFEDAYYEAQMDSANTERYVVVASPIAN